jgi:hypothetical protein
MKKFDDEIQFCFNPLQYFSIHGYANQLLFYRELYSFPSSSGTLSSIEEACILCPVIGQQLIKGNTPCEILNLFYGLVISNKRREGRSFFQTYTNSWMTWSRIRGGIAGEHRVWA